MRRRTKYCARWTRGTRKNPIHGRKTVVLCVLSQFPYILIVSITWYSKANTHTDVVCNNTCYSHFNESTCVWIDVFCMLCHLMYNEINNSINIDFRSVDREWRANGICVSKAHASYRCGVTLYGVAVLPSHISMYTFFIHTKNVCYTHICPHKWHLPNWPEPKYIIIRKIAVNTRAHYKDICECNCTCTARQYQQQHQQKQQQQI